MSGGSRHAAAQPEHLAGLLDPVVTAAGLELESVRVGRAGRRGLLRVVVDAEHGVTLDDIALVSRAIAAEVDASDAMGPGPYTLEVSSPGVDRLLTEPRHWRRATGRLVRVPVKDPAFRTAGATVPPGSGRSRGIEGRVVEAGASGVTLEVAGELRNFRYAELGPGQVQVEFGKLDGDRGQSPEGGTDVAGGGEPDGH